MIVKDSLARLKQLGVSSVPSGWRISRVKYLGKYMNGYPFKPKDWGTKGRPILRIQDLNSTNSEPNRFDGEIPSRYLVRQGDILLSWSASLGVYRWNGEESWLNQHIFKVSTNPIQVRETFFVWLAEWFINEMNRDVHGSTMQHLTADAFGSFPVLLPSLGEQARIADYLDRETARIDMLIATKERLLKLLDEKRRALITRAVTRGVDPDFPLRNSGVPWLGRIPPGWKTIALRFLVDFTSGSTPHTGTNELWDGGIPWASAKDMKKVEIDDTQDHVSELALSKGILRPIDPGSVLVVVRGLILARSFPAAVTTAQLTINQDMKALRCRGLIVPYFLRDYFRGIEKYILSLTTVSAHGTRKLETEVLGRLTIAVPPLQEQRAIVAHIDERTSKLDKIEATARATISLLKERRAAAIASAVTGLSSMERAT